MFNSILLPVNDTELSFKPVDAVIDLARMTGARLVVLSVAEPRLFRASDYDAVRSGREVEAMKLEQADDCTRRACAAAAEAGVACESAVSMSAEPEDEILDAVRRFQCDLVVMATRGKMGVVDTLFNESTTQEVIRKSPVPVLVFP